MAGYSAFGEDLWLDATFALPAHGIFVDVGAGESQRASNSLLFEKRGWWCLCIEPDPRHWDDLALHRARFEAAAITSSPGRTQFWCHDSKPTHSTLLPDPSESYRPIDVRGTTLAEIVRRYGIRSIDILDIDVEGAELDAWVSLDLAVVRPGLTIIEYADIRPNGAKADVVARLTTDGYELIHTTPANLIFVDASGRYATR